MNFKKKQNLDLTKTISIDDKYLAFINIEKTSKLLYYHSKDFTSSFKFTLNLFDKIKNKIIEKIDFVIPKESWETYIKTKKIPIILTFNFFTKSFIIIQQTNECDKQILHLIKLKKKSFSNKILTTLDTRVVNFKLDFNNSEIKHTENSFSISKNEFEFNFEIDTNEYVDLIFRNITQEEEEEGIIDDYNKSYKRDLLNSKAGYLLWQLKPEIRYLPYTIFTNTEWLLFKNEVKNKYSINNLEKIFENCLKENKFNHKQENFRELKQLLKEKIIINIRENINKTNKENRGKLIKPRIRESENYNSRNWLQDASGTDDPETMNDVYWNLD